MPDSRVQLLLGDCMERMKELPDNSVDMVLCDQPYGQTANPQDIRLPLTELWKEYKRICKPHAAIVLFCSGRFFIDLVNSNPRWYRYDLIWDKGLTTGFLNAKRMPLRKHEQIAVFYEKMPVYNPQFTEGKPLHGRGVAYLNKPLINNNYGAFHATQDERKGETKKYPVSILSFPKPHPSVVKHRTEKPIALMEYLVRTFTNEGDVVLDNCMGSGVTAIACIEANRQFIGIEKDPAIYYCAATRIKQRCSHAG